MSHRYEKYLTTGPRLDLKLDLHKTTTSQLTLTNGYSPPLTNLAAQTEFSQPQKDCSGSSKDAHGL